MLIPYGILSAAGAGIQFPSVIPNLVARYDAMDLSSITLSGSDVTQWNDLSGNARHATQTTSANRPKSGTRTINGYNALDFDGSNDYLLNNGVVASFTGEDKPFTIFMVSKSDTTASDLTAWSFGNSGSATMRFLQLGSSLFVRDDADVQTQLLITGSYNTNNQFITWRSTGLNFTGYINKTLTNTGTAYNRGTFTLNVATIGALRNSGSPSGTLYFNGLIGEVIYYNRELTTGEVTTVQDYLSAKWEI
jgi:hypothetical protein